MDEIDQTIEERIIYESSCKKVVEALKKNNVQAEYVLDRTQALDKVKAGIPAGASIGIGDSVTLHEIGLFSWLETGPRGPVHNPFHRTEDGHWKTSNQERFELMRQAMVSDVFLCSSNAVTLDGKIVNIDGRGNRVAAMLFGPKKVILVIGANKIVKDADAAVERIKGWCTGMNAQRHAIKHHMDFFAKLPCATSGQCSECNVSWRMCRKTVIIDGELRRPGATPNPDSGLNVIMVAEKLGI